MHQTENIFPNMKKFLILALLVASASCLTTDEYDDIYFQIFRQLFRLPSKASTVVRLSKYKYNHELLVYRVGIKFRYGNLRLFMRLLLSSF